MRPQVVGHTEQRRLDVIEPAKLLAAVGQPAIDRQCDAEWVEVCRRHREIFGDQEAAVPGAEIAHIERRSPPQLPIDRNRTLPVVKLFVEAGLRIICDADIAGSHLAKRLV